jgi:hypothetical protein
MGKNIVIYKASDFTYPTKEELKFASQLIPNLHTFEYEYISDMEALTCPGSELKFINKKNHLFWWNFCLQNKIGKLLSAYTNSITSYKRGIPSEDDNQNSKLYINLIQFDFYSETFYYFLFSVRDIILQIINVYFDLCIKEDKVIQRKVKDEIKKKLGDHPVTKLLTYFSEKFKDFENIRNSLTHRFPVNEPDYRSSYREVMYEPSRDILVKIKHCLPDKSQVNNPNNGTSHTVQELGFSAGFPSSKGMEPKKIYDHMIEACNTMSNFIQELKAIMTPI